MFSRSESNMKIYIEYFFLIFLLFQACSWFESDYDKFMNPIKKIKLEEKKLGKSPPIFNGITEPNFPNEKQNNETFKGLDSNNDGVRDDIEIWINRIAEDEFVREALKEYYRKQIDLFESLYKNESEEKVHSKLSLFSAMDGCLLVLTSQYDELYFKTHKQEAFRYYSNVLIYKLYSNTSLRSQQVSKWNSFQFKGVIGGDSEIECPKYSFGKRYKEIMDSNRLKH